MENKEEILELALKVVPYIYEGLNGGDSDLITNFKTVTYEKDTKECSQYCCSIHYTFNEINKVLFIRINNDESFNSVIDDIISFNINKNQLGAFEFTNTFNDDEIKFLKDVDKDFKGYQFEEIENRLKQSILKRFIHFNKGLISITRKYKQLSNENNKYPFGNDLVLLFNVEQDKDKEDFGIPKPSFNYVPNIIKEEDKTDGQYFLSREVPIEDAFIYDPHIDFINNDIINLTNDLAKGLEKLIKKYKDRYDNTIMYDYFADLYYSLVIVPLFSKMVNCYNVNKEGTLPLLETISNDLLKYLSEHNVILDPDACILFKVNEEGTKHVIVKEDEYIRNLFSSTTNNFGSVLNEYLKSLNSPFISGYVESLNPIEKEIDLNDHNLPKPLELI